MSDQLKVMDRLKGMMAGFFVVMITAICAAGVSNPHVFNFLTDTHGYIKTSPIEFYAEVATGHIPGHSSINKFGHNPTAGAGDDVWGGDGAYAFFPTNAQSVWAQSSVAGDDPASTGAFTVAFFGLDGSWNETNETVTMDGTTSVALTNTYIRMFRGYVVTAGAYEGNVGDITVTNGSGTVAIHIESDEGQTEHCIYTIPNNKTGYFIKGYVSMGNDNKNGIDSHFVWQARANNGVNGAWLTKGDVTLVNIGSSWWQYQYGIPAGPLPEKTDIRIRVTESDADVDAVGGFDLLLIEDGY